MKWHKKGVFRNSPFLYNKMYTTLTQLTTISYQGNYGLPKILIPLCRWKHKFKSWARNTLGQLTQPLNRVLTSKSIFLVCVFFSTHCVLAKNEPNTKSSKGYGFHTVNSKKTGSPYVKLTFMLTLVWKILSSDVTYILVWHLRIGTEYCVVRHCHYSS